PVLRKRPQHAIRRVNRKQNRQRPDHKDWSALGIGSGIEQSAQGKSVDHEHTDKRYEHEGQPPYRILPDEHDFLKLSFPQVFTHLNHHHVRRRGKNEIDEWNLKATYGIDREGCRIEVPRYSVLVIILLD